MEKSLVSRRRRRKPPSLQAVEFNTKTKDEEWDDFCKAIDDKNFVPVISNSIRLENIFETEGDESNYTIKEQLAELWARSIKFPLEEKHSLGTVAQFNSVIAGNILSAKTNYLDFLKSVLLGFAERDEDIAGLVPNLREQENRLSFSDIAQGLDLPYFDDKDQDALRLLARLEIPVYITTSHHDFLERLIKAEGREDVKTHICPWGDFHISEEYLPSPNFKPSVKAPVVYHLFGHEAVKHSLVLSEDDHLDFLVRIFHDLSSITATQETGTNTGRLPMYIRTALKEGALMLLGYRLQDWEFRTLYRGALMVGEAPLRGNSIAIQLEPEKQKGIDKEYKEAAYKYLLEYFRSPFKVKWGTPKDTVAALFKAWQIWKSS